MSRRARRLLLAGVVVGIAARVVVAFRTYGVPYDTDSMTIVRDALRDDPLHVYSLVNAGPLQRWPYLPGFFAWIAPAGWLSDHVGLAFHGWVHLPQIAADAALALLVQYYLGLRGAGERVRLAAAALVLFGPSFAVVSGHHGQIDQLAVLPAVAALVVWDRSPPGVGRALAAGALIGAGIAIKTVPVVMLVALLPWVRSWREGAALAGPAILVPLLVVAPWLIADGQATVDSLRRHRALVGFGGISLVLQPELAKIWFLGEQVRLSAINRTLLEHQSVVVAILMAPFAGLVALRRPDPAVGAVILWLALEVMAVGFAFQYVVWALPFALMAGYVWQVAAVQAALLLPTLMLYRSSTFDDPRWIYVPIMIALWAVLTAALLAMAARLAHREV